ncbi:unnamed protein product [Toxocara canis]|uniref:Secreted protein n=1 Tax=Toxocara canis TaxID=6265 RepID=A0A183TVZ7_TOXCA|nr:unnamed protein product [Toxocara canis]
MSAQLAGDGGSAFFGSKVPALALSCSSTPVCGFVEATSTAPFETTHLSGPVGADLLVAQFKGAPIDAQEPQSLFKSG